MTRVLSTQEFDTWEKMLSKDYQAQIKNFIEQLKRNPHVGKPLGYRFFREKKMDGYRVYFLVYDDVDVVLLVTISDKKAQSDIIGQIKNQLHLYRDLIRRNL